MKNAILFISVICSVLALGNSYAFSGDHEELEGAFATSDGDCLAVLNSMKLTGVIHPENTLCQTTDGMARITFRLPLKPALTGKLMDAAQCTIAARALYSSFLYTDNSSDALTGYCAPDSPGNARLEIRLHVDRNRNVGTIRFPSKASCDATRNAVIDSGLALQALPTFCSSVDGKLYSLSLSFSKMDLVQTLKSRVVISLPECELAVISLPMFLGAEESARSHLTLECISNDKSETAELSLKTSMPVQ